MDGHDADRAGPSGTGERQRTVTVSSHGMTGSAQRKKFLLHRRSSFSLFKRVLFEKFEIPDHEKFTITTNTERTISDNDSLNQLVNDGDTLHLSKQPAPGTPVRQAVNIQPHYDTIVKSGQYDYYASEGRDPLPFAFAELIDNALSATHFNEGKRQIEVRLFVDGGPKHEAVCVIDNGKGMNKCELSNWAVVRLSKFNARRGDVREDTGLDEPRFLNSDISFFGVGGKQAIFFMGECVRMVTKTKDSEDVHEMTISKEKFQKREEHNKSVYKEALVTRRPGDLSTTSPEESKFVTRLISDEVGKESFTHVIVTKLRTENFRKLKKDKMSLCRELAHTYHYYIHGPRGNPPSGNESLTTSLKPVDIIAAFHDSKGNENKCFNLRDVQTDPQSLFLKSAQSSFEFQIRVPMTLEKEDADEQPVGKKEGVVEGVLRYHPFLHDSETYPCLEVGQLGQDEDAGSDDRTSPVFECFWQGRRIPYTSIKGFEWCMLKKGEKGVPKECYNRISGVLFTNDFFKVSSNKLTFMDLDDKLKGRLCTTNRICDGKLAKRSDIRKEFKDWMRHCHTELDKEICFFDHETHVFKENAVWSKYRKIKWDGRTFEQGKLVKTIPTPVVHGIIQGFLLPGYHSGEIYATGGEFELQPTPIVQGSEVKTFPLAKLDRVASEEKVSEGLREKRGKFPEHLVINWPNGNNMTEVEDGSFKIQAGQQIYEIQAIIRSREGKDVSKLPGTAKGKGRLGVKLTVVWHTPDGDKTILSIENSSYNKNWGYGFNPIDVASNHLGRYTLHLEVMVLDTPKVEGALALPEKNISFIVTEGPSSNFRVRLPSKQVRIGVPFTVTLEFVDKMGNASSPTPDMQPVIAGAHKSVEIHCSGEMKVEKSSIIMQHVEVTGNLGGTKKEKRLGITVSVPQLIENETKKPTIQVSPGVPKVIHVPAFSKPFQHENGTVLKLEAVVKDCAGNPVWNESKMQAKCEFTGLPNMPVYKGAVSPVGTILLKGPTIDIQNLKRGQQELTATISLPDYGEVPSVQQTLVVHPRRGPNMIKVIDLLTDKQLEQDEEVSCIAGEKAFFAIKLLDEAERTITISKQLADKISLSWCPKIPEADIKSGKLPVIQTPEKVEPDPRFYKIDVTGTEVNFRFSIRATHGYATKVKWATEQKTTTTRCGETLDMSAKLVDRYGNEDETVPSCEQISLQVDGETVEFEDICTGKGACFIVRGIKFDPTTNLGNRRLRIRFRSKSNRVDHDECTINLVPGLPIRLVPDMNDDETIQVNSGKGLQKPLIFRLKDKYGHPSSDETCSVKLKWENGVRITSKELLVVVPNEIGEAVFNELIIAGPRGVYKVWAETGDRRLRSPAVKLEIVPNPRKPQQVKISGLKECEVGAMLACIDVEVIAEDGSRMVAIGPEQLTFKSRPVDVKSQETPTKGSGKGGFIVESTTEADGNGCFHYRNIRAPHTPGKYLIWFCFEMKENEPVNSKKIVMTIHPGKPVRLCARNAPEMSFVSSSGNDRERTIIEDLFLYVEDRFGNVAGTNSSGNLALTITGDDENVGIPKVDTNDTIQFTEGCAHVENISLQPFSPDISGAKFSMQLNFQSGDLGLDIQPFCHPFILCSDIKEQQEMAQLSKQKEELENELRPIQLELHKYQEQENEIKEMIRASQDELKTHIRNTMNSHLLAREAKIDSALIREIRKQAEDAVRKIDEGMTRKCQIPAYRKKNSNQILGKVAHLAAVEDAHESAVLAWHLGSAMECVVTKTSQQAAEIDDESGGDFELLALEEISLFEQSSWDKPLPHEANESEGSDVSYGNPVYAKHQLKIHGPDEECKLVFSQLLGDTIIIDSLQDAKAYRHKISQKMSCPTLLTRDGHRLQRDGRFGGHANRCPKDMGGRIFSEHNQELVDMKRQIGHLLQAEKAVEKRDKAQEDITKHINAGNRICIQEKQKILNRLSEEHGTIQEKLSKKQINRSTSSRKRSFESDESDDDDGDSSAKRSRHSATSS